MASLTTLSPTRIPRALHQEQMRRLHQELKSQTQTIQVRLLKKASIENPNNLTNEPGTPSK